MLGHAELIKKLYFPREVLVISSCLTALVMAFFEFIVFLIFTLLSNVALSTTLLIVPIIIFLEFILALGVALPLSAMNTAYRDVQYIWRILLQVGFFITPIIYSITIFPPEYRQAVMLNPVARLIDMVRATAIYATLPSVNSFIYVALFSLISLIVGMFIFRKYEWKLAEEV
jgi:lipopolysaccharide transport system permease protein